MAIKNVAFTQSKKIKNRIKKIYWNDLYNLICSVILIKNKPDDIPERWIKDLLLLNGEFAIYDKMILEIVGNNGYYVYNEPVELLLKTPNNLNTFIVETNSIKWIGANQLRSGIAEYLTMQVDKLVEIEQSFIQNLKASRSGDIIGVKDENVRLSILQAILQNASGEPFVVVNKDLIDNDNFVQIKLSTEYIADKLNQLKQEVYNETLIHFGILNANSNKRERVQVGEIEATSDFAYDSIYSIIESANRDLENSGETMRFEFNGAIDDFTPNREINEISETNENED